MMVKVLSIFVVCRRCLPTYQRWRKLLLLDRIQRHLTLSIFCVITKLISISITMQRMFSKGFTSNIWKDERMPVYHLSGSRSNTFANFGFSFRLCLWHCEKAYHEKKVTLWLLSWYDVLKKSNIKRNFKKKNNIMFSGYFLSMSHAWQLEELFCLSVGITCIL